MSNIEILAHRGCWENEEEKNTLNAFKKAFELGFGVETDLRDISGKIVISHDMPKGNEISFEDLLIEMNGRNLPLALNIKADGLAKEIHRILEKYNHTNYFTFDMSIPEMIIQNKLGLKFFTGKSDVINFPIMFNESKGIWLDSFYSDWFEEKEIKEILAQDKKVCIVSPELHKREYKSVWQKYRNINGIMLCTDFPLEAKEFFNV